eukprot:TRINITY_DN4681_c0_g2_i1.p2 TRINITY_DN4681_c0_g2~~TRINITY_DN4681_c0_g2_i1.p2  ORF type:complete len:233 (+),score=39.90 TRINITY_DN4681_c0_g2_i1:117-815(+)
MLGYFGGTEQLGDLSESSESEISGNSEEEQEEQQKDAEDVQNYGDDQQEQSQVDINLTQQTSNGKGTGLISAENAFEEISGPPAFLDPEAIRPLNQREIEPVSKYSSQKQKHEEQLVNQETDKFDKKRKKVEQDQECYNVDVSRMAPPLKVHRKEHQINAKAVRYESGNQNRNQVKGAMEVSEFLNKGVGGAQLPRKNQDRKEREKNKRSIGQSCASTWKSEAEMVLRQQYD